MIGAMLLDEGMVMFFDTDFVYIPITMLVSRREE